MLSMDETGVHSISSTGVSAFSLVQKIMTMTILSIFRYLRYISKPQKVRQARFVDQQIHSTDSTDHIGERKEILSV